jgi:endonuclease YncB( thermonuclease family)
MGALSDRQCSIGASALANGRPPRDGLPLGGGFARLGRMKQMRKLSCLPLALAACLAALETVAQEAPAPDPVPVPPVESETLPPPPPMEFEGAAAALDGMTVQIGDYKLLLFGIATPDLRAPDGLRARMTLDRLIAGRSDVHCTEAPRDDGFRRRAVCKSGEADLAEALLAEGVAIVDRFQTRAKGADRGISNRYDAAEASARQSAKGLWAPFAVPPPPPEPVPPTRAERINAWIEKWQAGFGSLLGVLIVGLLLVVARWRGRERASGK